MKYLFFLMFISLLSCSKKSLKHCYECKTVRAAAGQIRVIHPCGTSKQIAEIENTGYSYTRYLADGSQTAEIVPLVCEQKDY
jgi:hypothetical protein